jgi:hypothetical protein
VYVGGKSIPQNFIKTPGDLMFQSVTVSNYAQVVTIDGSGIGLGRN